MDETPDIAPEDPDIPEEPPPPDSGIEVADQPLGVPDEADADESPLPGVPENEPPASG
jgi:hypothetical protein